MTVTRKLAAILAADVAGYSRLMGADEEGTLERLKAHRRELIDPKIAEHRGRIVKTTGDGMLVEFASPVEAVRCAVEIQRSMVDRNASEPPERRITFRVGVNLGDIIIEGRDIYGDGVNIAARLEGLAEPSGICISRAVREQVRDKLPYAFADMGEQTVKNIARPVRVYALTASEVASLLIETATPKPRTAAPWLAGSSGVIAASVTLLVAVGTGAWWFWPMPHAPPNRPVVQQASAIPTSDAANIVQPAVASRLSIVVLRRRAKS
jgi:adenylate cyclase